MRSLYSFIIGLFIISSISAQRSIYEAGYFINNKGKIKKCLIKKLAWNDNPTKFEWKKSISSKPKTESIKNVKEFGVGKEFLFKRHTLKFDINGDTVGKSTKSKDPNLTRKKVFLRYIIKSKVSLYEYSENNVHRFFYTDSKNKIPKLLVYKTYYKQDKTKKPGEKVIPKQNNTYQKQLAKKIKCKNQDASRLDYTQNDLKKYFKRYNTCKGYKIEYSIRKKINQTKLGIIAAADLTDFSHPSVIPNSINQEITYNTTYTPRYGIYIESFIPFSKVGLSFFLETTYKEFSSEGVDPLVSNLTYKLDYKSINAAFAPRLHLYLSSSFELFLEGGVNAAFDIGINSTNAFEDEEIQNISTNYFYGGGIGAGRLKIGFRQYTDANFSKSTALPTNKLTTSSLYISLNIF